MTYEQIRKLADYWHDKAAHSGDPKDYERAAELYEEIQDYKQAKQCREAASVAVATAV